MWWFLALAALAGLGSTPSSQSSTQQKQLPTPPRRPVREVEAEVIEDPEPKETKPVKLPPWITRLMNPDERVLFESGCIDDLGSPTSKGIESLHRFLWVRHQTELAEMLRGNDPSKRLTA
jgi:hypothetical protein